MTVLTADRPAQAPTAELLSAAAERELATAMEAGVLAAEALTSGREVAGQPTEAELRQLVREGEAARLRFAEANVGLVRMVTRPLAARSGTAEADIFQEACLGLLVAIRGFDHRRGFRFATYALCWIRAHAGAATARLLDLNLSTSRAVQLRTLRGVQAQLSQVLGRAATARDVALQLGRSEQWVAELLGHQAPSSLSSLPPDVLDALLGSSDEPPPARPGPGPAEMLHQLDHLGRAVLELRMGFTAAGPLGYADVARRLRLSVSRVRRIEQAALEVLRGVCPYDAVDGW